MFGFEERMLLLFSVIVNQKMLLRDMYPKIIKYAKLSGTPFRGVRSRTQKAAPVKRGVKVDGARLSTRLVFMNLYLVLN